MQEEGKEKENPDVEIVEWRRDGGSSPSRTVYSWYTLRSNRDTKFAYATISNRGAPTEQEEDFHRTMAFSKELVVMDGAVERGKGGRKRGAAN